MNRAVLLVLLALAVATSSACSHSRASAPASQPPPARPAGAAGSAAAPTETDPIDAAADWLALVDEGRYEASWSRASSLFRERIDRAQWITVIRGVRAGLGPLRDRSFSSLDYASLDSRTAALIVWKSDFEAFSPAVEQVTMILDEGTWKCAGYFVRKRDSLR